MYTHTHTHTHMCVCDLFVYIQHMCAYSSFIHNCQNWEATKLPFSR